MKATDKVKRRDLLKWIPPVVTVVTLPSHAMTSTNTEGENTLTVAELLEILRPILFNQPPSEQSNANSDASSDNE